MGISLLFKFVLFLKVYVFVTTVFAYLLDLLPINHCYLLKKINALINQELL